MVSHLRSFLKLKYFPPAGKLRAENYARRRRVESYETSTNRGTKFSIILYIERETEREYRFELVLKKIHACAHLYIRRLNYFRIEDLSLTDPPRWKFSTYNEKRETTPRGRGNVKLFHRPNE